MGNSAKSGAGGSKKGKEKSHAEHRQEQRERAYQNRVARWQKSMTEAGVSEDVQKYLTYLYDRDTARLGKPPKIKISSAREAFFRRSDNSITLHANKDDWYGHVITAEHEFGHWTDNNSRFRKNLTFEQKIRNAIALQVAAQKDWDALKKKHRGNLSVFKSGGKYEYDVSQRIFGMQPQTMSQRKAVGAYMDVIGSMSKGRYGYGHTKTYYESDYSRAEIFTHAKSAILRKDANFKLDFPNTWDYVNSVIKEIHK